MTFEDTKKQGYSDFLKAVKEDEEFKIFFEGNNGFIETQRLLFKHGYRWKTYGQSLNTNADIIKYGYIRACPSKRIYYNNSSIDCYSFESYYNDMLCDLNFIINSLIHHKESIE